jgi:hypothetical protein
VRANAAIPVQVVDVHGEQNGAIYQEVALGRSDIAPVSLLADDRADVLECCINGKHGDHSSHLHPRHTARDAMPVMGFGPHCGPCDRPGRRQRATVASFPIWHWKKIWSTDMMCVFRPFWAPGLRGRLKAAVSWSDSRSVSEWGFAMRIVWLAQIVVIVGLIFGGFYYWARRQKMPAAKPAVEGEQGRRRISLLTEAVAYVGAILILAGGVAAIGQRWHGFTDWAHVGAFAGAAVFFLLVGVIVRRVREPAIQRLVDVVWFLSVAGVAGAVGFAAHDVYGNSGPVTALAVGVAVTVYAAALWLARQHALQNLAVFAGLVVTICGLIATIDSSAPSLAFALALWGFGLAWVALGWRRYVEPLWVTVPSGVILALIAPSLAAGEHGWVYAIGIATAAAAMAASVPLRNTPLLALGTLAMFGYVTSVVIRYFHQSLGVPGALAITGVLILGLAAVSARLMRQTRPPKPEQPGGAEAVTGGTPAHAQKPGGEKPSQRDLPKAS